MTGGERVEVAVHDRVAVLTLRHAPANFLSLALAEVKFLAQNRRHPVLHHPARERRQREVYHQEDECAVREQFTQ